MCDTEWIFYTCDYSGIGYGNDRAVYDFFNSPFPDDYGISAMNIPPIPMNENICLD